MKLEEGSRKQKAGFPHRRGSRSVVSRRGPEAMSPPGKATERDARRSILTVQLWRSVPKKPASGRRTPLGRRLDELRERIKASGEPLLSWEQLDRELAERRGEAVEEER